MAEVTVVGAGLAGLTAAINCARSGHRVRVLEKRERVGGDPRIRPTVDVTPMEPGKLGRFIGIELGPPFVVPTREFLVDVYGKKFLFPGDYFRLHSVERGSRSTSLDTYLYDLAREAGVEFEFGTNVGSREEFERLPANTIVATGLEAEPFLALGRPYLDVFGFVAVAPCEGEPRILGYFDRNTRYYHYCANLHGTSFALAFNTRPLPDSACREWAERLEEEGFRFREWRPHKGVVATRGVSAPALFAGDKILAGTLAGVQDPLFLFGVHGSLVSGKIAAMAVEDREHAWRLFRRFTSRYRYMWLYKTLFDLQPHFLRRPGLNLAFGCLLRFPALLRPLLDEALKSVPGFGMLG
ncbi:NAD(P)/FAD-dependent oxidoreductase [Candidatus Solincola sp.]